MAKKKPTELPQVEIKEFAPVEIDSGIRKLKRRIDEVKALNPQRDIAQSSGEFEIAARKIRDTIMEVFGPNSPEFGDHEYIRIWAGASYVNMPEWERIENKKKGIIKTENILEDLIARLEEKRSDIEAGAHSGVRSSLEGLELHPRIAEACIDLFNDGHYSSAVFEASKALISYVKDRSRRHDLDGTKLMSTVFSANSPILAFSDLETQTEKDEQEGMMHLYMGVALGVRNPRGHSFIEDSPERAIEYIGLINLLSKRLGESELLT